MHSSVCVGYTQVLLYFTFDQIDNILSDTQDDSFNAHIQKEDCVVNYCFTRPKLKMKDELQ